MVIGMTIAIALIAYAIGSVNFSIIFSKKFAGFDVREKGSGNAGTTNMLRTVGKGAAALTLVCDILKGVFAVLMALAIGYFVGYFVRGEQIMPFLADNYEAILVQLAAFFVVLGHTFPIFFKFKGGKGVATALGVLLLINWQIGLICLFFALILIILTRMVSLGSTMAAILFPVLIIFGTLTGNFGGSYIQPGNYIIFSILFAALVLFNHRSNIKRIMDGTENRISFKKKKEDDINNTENENVEVAETVSSDDVIDSLETDDTNKEEK